MSQTTTTDANQGAGEQTAENQKPAETTGGTQTGETTSSEEQTQQPKGEKTFTQEEVNRLIAKEKREFERKAKEAEERAKLSEDERTKAEIESLKRENQMLKAEAEITRELKTAGAKSPELLFAASKERIEFDKDGKLSNVKDLIAELKSLYPDQFGVEKPAETIDGGKGKGEEPKGKPENLSEALKNFYKK